MKAIPYGRQEVTEEDIRAVVTTLKSDFLTQGPKIKEFEEAFASYVGSKYAVAVSNGTAALHLSALALGVKQGSRIITTPLTFAASANCILYCGGEVTFADIDPDTYLIDIDQVRELLEDSPRNTYCGIIPVDLAGRPVNLEEIRELADEYDLWIIEDSCHAPGGFFIDSIGKYQKCGSGEFADLSIFSFHPVKHIATGEGGMITTNDESLYNKLMTLRTHGISRDNTQFENSVSLACGVPVDTEEWPGWYMEMNSLGYNYRITDLQAALGISQLKRADAGLEKRNKIAKKYFEAFNGNPNILGQSGVVEGHAYHLYIIEVEDRLNLYKYLRESSIYAQVHYIPTHLMPYYKKFGWRHGDFAKAEKYYSRCLSLPMFPSLTDDEQNFVIERIKEFYSN